MIRISYVSIVRALLLGNKNFSLKATNTRAPSFMSFTQFQGFGPTLARPVPDQVRSRLATAQRRSQPLLDELTRPLDQVVDNEGRGLDLVHQPDTLAHQEIHGLDISRCRRVRGESHEPQHRYSLARNLGLAHHRFIWP